MQGVIVKVKVEGARNNFHKVWGALLFKGNFSFWDVGGSFCLWLLMGGHILTWDFVLYFKSTHVIYWQMLASQHILTQFLPSLNPNFNSVPFL